MGGMAGVGVAPPPNHPPTSLAGGSTRARHPGPSIARARCGGKRYPGCLSVPLPPKSPDFHPADDPLQTAPFLIARYDDARAKPTHARALRRRRRSLARSIARAVCGGSDGVRLHRPSRALRASRVTRAHAHVIAAHRARRHRFPFPLHARMRALRAATALARSLARSLARARAVWRWRWRWRSVTPRVTRVTRARVNVITARRARHRRFSFPPCTTGTRALQRRRRSLAPSIARARCGGGDGGCGRSRRT